MNKKAAHSNKSGAEQSLEELIFGKNILGDALQTTSKGTSSKRAARKSSEQGAWSDDDDDDVSVDLAATNRLKKLRTDNNKSSKVSGKELTALLQKRYAIRPLEIIHETIIIDLRHASE